MNFPKYYRFFPLVVILCFAFLGGMISLGALWAVDNYTKNKQIDEVLTNYSKEREYKQQLQKLLDTQLTNNDELVIAQTNLNNEIQDLLQSVKNSFRIIDGRTELLSTADGRALQSGQDQVNIELENVEKKLEKISTDKETAKKERDRIFNESNQNLQNRADPRDGTKN
ncbi:MAG: hypothetical protein OHK0017_04500 [Patescibacteria group bacterium]